MSKPFIVWQRPAGRRRHYAILVITAICIGGFLGWVGKYFSEASRPDTAGTQWAPIERAIERPKAPAVLISSAPAALSPVAAGGTLKVWSNKFRSASNLGAFVHDALADGSLAARIIAKRAVLGCLLIHGSTLSTANTNENVRIKTMAGRLSEESVRCRTLTDVYPDLSLTMQSIKDGRYVNSEGVSPYWLTGFTGLTLDQLVSDFNLAVGTGDPDIIQQSIQGLLSSRQVTELQYDGAAINRADSEAMLVAFDLARCEVESNCLAREIRICNLEPRDCGVPVWDLMKRDSTPEEFARLAAFKELALRFYSSQSSLGTFSVSPSAPSAAPPR